MHALHKILADKARPERAAVTPGEFLEIEPDVYSAIVGVNAGEAKRLAADLAELGVKELPLRDRIYANSDHASPAPTVALAASQNAWRDFYRSYGIKIFDGGVGVSHLVMVEQGIVVPGSMAIAVDSHGATMGAVGAYATSLGGGRLTLYALGRHWIEVPKVTLVRISGKIKKGVLGRDVALYVNGRLGQRGAYGNAVEFAGSFVEHLSMDLRFTLCNMGVELGAVASYIQPDATTLDWVKERSHLFRGVTYGTIVRGEAFDFSRIGTFLERADNTARILDVKYHLLLPSVADVGGALDYYQWAALLRSVSSFETYRALYRDQILPIRVAELFILERRMPRSLAACFDQITVALGRTRGQQDAPAKRLASELNARLTHANIEEIFQGGLHEYLESCLEDFAELGSRIQRAYLGAA